MGAYCQLRPNRQAYQDEKCNKASEESQYTFCEGTLEPILVAIEEGNSENIENRPTEA